MKSLPPIVPIACVLALAAFTTAAHANATADAVVDYDPGAASSTPTYQLSGTPALGLPASTDGYGTDVTPFTPPWSTDDLTEVGSGGYITLHLSAPITPAASPQLGVFSDVGLVAAFDPDSGAITATTATFEPPSQAIVSVSADGTNFIALNGGAPITFSNPTSAFTDSSISYDPTFQYVSADSGSAPADFFQPFTGTLDDLNGETYAQMTATLDGSAGGTWLDVSSAGLPEVNYVRFDVPAGDDLILDAVTAVPEPASLGLLVVGLLALARRRQR